MAEKRPNSSAPLESVGGQRSTALYDAPIVKPPEPDTLLEKCPDCSGSLKGLNSPNCPGCGVNIISAIRRHQSNAAGRAEVVDRYRRALIPLVVAYAVWLLVLLVLGDEASPANGHMSDLAWFALRQAVFVPLAVVIYWVFCVMWLRFEQPFAISIMAIMTATAVSDVAGFFLWWVPVLFAYQVVVALVLTAVATKLLELEYTEGFAVGFTLGAVRYIVHLGLATSV